MTDPVLASRLQFAARTIVHIVFPVMSMGLAPFLVYFTWKDIRTGESIYEQLRRSGRRYSRSVSSSGRWPASSSSSTLSYRLRMAEAELARQYVRVALGESPPARE